MDRHELVNERGAASAALETSVSVADRSASPWRIVARGLLEDGPLLLCIAVFIAVTLILQRFTGYPAHISWGNWWKLFSVFTLLYAFGALLVMLVYTVIVRKRSLRRADTWRWLLGTLLPPVRTLNFVILTGAFGLLMPTFLGYKQSIPLVQPFSWDVAFMEWDRVLHFGRQPFEWLQPLLGHPAVTRFIDRTYFLWIHVMWMSVIWQSWHGSRQTPVRSQFLLSFVLCWILLGTVMAVLLSSAGPIFFSGVTDHPDPYRALMSYLYSVDAVQELRVLRLRGFLWESYLSPDAGSLGGISAMPSMHVAIVTLLTLLGFSVNRWLGWAYAAFATIIVVGSVHLAWHYAVDSYVAIAATIIVWVVSGYVVRWWRRLLDQRAKPLTHVDNGSPLAWLL